MHFPYLFHWNCLTPHSIHTAEVFFKLFLDLYYLSSRHILKEGLKSSTVVAALKHQIKIYFSR